MFCYIIRDVTCFPFDISYYAHTFFLIFLLRQNFNHSLCTHSNGAHVAGWNSSLMYIPGMSTMCISCPHRSVPFMYFIPLYLNLIYNVYMDFQNLQGTFPKVSSRTTTPGQFWHCGTCSSTNTALKSSLWCRSDNCQCCYTLNTALCSTITH